MMFNYDIKKIKKSIQEDCVKEKVIEYISNDIRQKLAPSSHHWVKSDQVHYQYISIYCSELVTLSSEESLKIDIEKDFLKDIAFKIARSLYNESGE